MLWLYLVIIAQLINAVVVLWDKYLVSGKTPLYPAAYAFYTSMLSGVVIVLIPFGVISVPSPMNLELLLAIGLTYVFSILFLYEALRAADASDVAPVVGAVAAISSFILGIFFLGEHLTEDFYIAFALLVTGTVLMSYFRFNKRTLIYTFSSGLFFGLSLVFTKLVFSQMSFINGFFWSRMANVVGGWVLLAWPDNVKYIFYGMRSSSLRLKSAIVANKALAGAAFLLILIGTKLGSVTVVNALSGVEFAFLLVLAFVFRDQLPRYLYENVKEKSVAIQKVVGLSFIIAGLIFLFI